MIKESEKDNRRLRNEGSVNSNSRHSLNKHKQKTSVQVRQITESNNGHETPRKKFASPNPSPMPKIQDTINLKSHDTFSSSNKVITKTKDNNAIKIEDLSCETDSK